MFLHRLFILIFFCSINLETHSQTPIIEGLKNKISQSTSSEEKINYVFRLCEEKQSMSTETHRYYVALATILSNSLDNDYYKDLANAEQAFLMAKEQKIDSALLIVNNLLEKYEKARDRDFISKLLVLKGRILDRGFRRFDMIDINLSRLQECERYRDTMCLVMSMNSMGWCYLELQKNTEALTWLKRALQLNYSNTSELKKYNCLYSNTALAFHRLGIKDSAEFYIDLAIQYGRETQTLTFLANSLSFRAQMLMRTPRVDVARESLNEAITIRKLLGDSYYILFDLLELARLHFFEKNYPKSIELCKEGIPIAYNSGMKNKLPEIYQLLADNYEATGNHAENVKTLKQLLFVKDSLTNAYTASLRNIETRYEVQKKENVIMQQNFDLAKKNYFLIGSLVLFVVVLIAAYFIFREYKRRQKMKTQVLLEEEKRIGAQAVIEAEESERKRIAADLHDNLGAQANAILYGTELLRHEKEEKELLVNDLHHTAKDMLTSLRETLWALKNSDVTAADVWLRIINFSKQMARHYATIKIQTEGAVPEKFHLISSKALNIVFIIQEAVNNAIRHAGATHISINASFSETQWNISVSDNGHGFDLEAANKKQESYGLSNMKERASVAGLHLNIDSQMQHGTKIGLQIPQTIDNP